MNSSERGAVSVWWLIIMLVLVLAGGFATYTQFGEVTKQRQAKEAVQASLAAAESKAREADEALVNLSQVVGYKDTGKLSISRIDQIQQATQGLRDNFSSVGPDAATLNHCIDALVAHVRDLQNQLNTSRDQLQQAQDARDAAENNRVSTISQKDTDFQSLQQQLDDERTRAASQEQQDQSRIADLQSQIDDIEARNRARLSEVEAEKVALADRIRERDSRISELTRKLAVLRLPDQPDGTILQVSDTGVCYVDLGRKHMLRRGTRFKVFTNGKGGTMIPKGLIEVRKVNEEMSEATVLEVYDEYLPLASGDMIAAPLYSPNQEREFVLVGRFPAGYSSTMVADRLRSLGAKVADQVTASTDILVLGDTEQSDDPDEGMRDPRDSEAFQRAQQFQVQVIAVREILDYVKFE